MVKQQLISLKAVPFDNGGYINLGFDKNNYLFS